MDSLHRLSPLALVFLFVVVASGCGRDRAGSAGLAGRTSIFRDGGGSASCTQICNNLRRIDSADPECPLELPPDCEAECEAQEDVGEVGACFASAADCRELVNCVDDGTDPPPPPPRPVDAGSSGGEDAGPGFDAGGGFDAGSGGCTNTCSFAGDGECDDGGEGSMTSVCELGTDCTDCGPR